MSGEDAGLPPVRVFVESRMRSISPAIRSAMAGTVEQYNAAKIGMFELGCRGFVIGLLLDPFTRDIRLVSVPVELHMLGDESRMHTEAQLQATRTTRRLHDRTTYTYRL